MAPSPEGEGANIVTRKYSQPCLTTDEAKLTFVTSVLEHS
jgi:hypothetical protein